MDSCERTTNLGNYGTACAGNNWLKIGATQWTLTPSSSSSANVFNVSTGGNLHDSNASYDTDARPSIYLKSNIAIMGGSGNYSDPFKIS